MLFFRTGEKLPELLSNCDYVCSVLPSTPSTDGLLDGDVLSHCRHKVLASSVSFVQPSAVEWPGQVPAMLLSNEVDLLH